MLTHGSLFSGIGGFELGAERAGIKTIWSCEIEEFQRKVLQKNFPETKIYEDIKELREPEYVDIISGGFPCQDISVANSKATGIKGSRSGLWSEMFRICREVRPKYIIIENSSMLLKRGFEQVLCDLSKIGYNAEWQCLSGTTFGIQHIRERIYCIANSNEIGTKGSSQKTIFRQPFLYAQSKGISPNWRTRGDIPEPRTFRSVDDVPNLIHRIGSLGNAVMPTITEYLFNCILDYDKGLK